ncbi:MAG: metallophosphoesterase [Anaerolineae bacterium]
MSAITWLHLSDLHFDADRHTRWQQNVVLQALLEDLRDPEGGGKLRPDLVFVTGDVACHGQPQEYALASSFFDDLLRTLGLPKSRLFVVPGNHDVNRARVSDSARALAAQLDGPDAVSRLLSTPADRRWFLSRLEDYRAFVRSYLRGQPSLSQRQFHFVRILHLAGLRLAVLGLNSAWLAYGGAADALHLALGEAQVREALEAAREADVRIALVHHPFEWLMEGERQRCEPLLLQGCDFVLSGHLHHTNLLHVGTPDGDANVFAGGAAYETRQYYNSYNLTRLDPASEQGVVYLRAFSPEQGGFWTADARRYRRVKDGVFAFAWPLRKRAWSQWPYELLSKHLRYEYLDDRHMRQTKRFVLQACCDGITHFRDRYRWSGLGTCRLSLLSPGASLHGPEPSPESAQPDGSGPWYVYDVRFPGPLARGDVRELALHWDLYDEAGKAGLFYGSTVNVPTRHLTMEIVLHRRPRGVRGLIIPPDPQQGVIQANDLSINLRPNSIVWRVENPVLWCRYVIVWQWR